VLQEGGGFKARRLPEANEMIVGLMAVIAEGERRMISQRTKVALAAAKARGTVLGGFRGYIPSREDSLASAAVLKAKAKAFAADLAPIIVELRAQGVTSLNAIAQALTAQGVPTARGSSVWTAAGVARVFKLID
jgi:DNA invertase Pin-like site-specific DNA recombinase